MDEIVGSGRFSRSHSDASHKRGLAGIPSVGRDEERSYEIDPVEAAEQVARDRADVAYWNGVRASAAAEREEAIRIEERRAEESKRERYEDLVQRPRHGKVDGHERLAQLGFEPCDPMSLKISWEKKQGDGSRFLVLYDDFDPSDYQRPEWYAARQIGDAIVSVPCKSLLETVSTARRLPMPDKSGEMEFDSLSEALDHAEGIVLDFQVGSPSYGPSF